MNDTTNLCNFYQPQEFCRQVTQRLEVIAPHQYAIVVLDIKNFSEINNLFGYKVGNQVLHRLETCFGAALKQDEFFCRLHGDHFAFFVHIEPQVSLRSRFLALTEFTNCLSGILPDLYPCVCKGGIIFIDNPAEDVVALLDKADFARKHAKDNQNRDFLYFDPKLAQELKWRNTITLTMQEALDNHEFEMYLQPKVLIKTGQVVGAEALTRWNSKKYGLIYPDQFIPILEKNGFIVQLDFYILGQACQFIQESLAAGRPPQPISINFSKAHLGRKDFAEIVFEVVRQYGIPTRLIEIEMTESMMSNDMQLLIDIASSLKYLGFKVSLDDFGSAYSSLNYLKDMPFDLIKIDKEFLNTTTNTNKGLVIVAKMVELIKSIQMIPVMEGVETAEQVDFLEKSSCDLGQGYFFSQPLPIGEYKAYLDRSSILADGDSQPCTGEQQPPQQNFYAIPMEFQMDNWELYTLGKNIDMGLMKGYLDGDATVQYVNDRALDYLCCTRQEFREFFHNTIFGFIHPADVDMVRENLSALIKTNKPLRFSIRAIRQDGKIIILQGHSSCVIDNNGRPIGIHAFQDVTEDLERAAAMQCALEDKIAALNALVTVEQENQEALRLSEERYRLVVEQSGDILFEWNFATDHIHFADKHRQLFKRLAIEDNLTTNRIIRQLIHPDDQDLFENWIQETYKKSGFHKGEFRVETGENRYIWISSSSTAICDRNGNPLKAVGVFSDISNQKEEMDILVRKSQLDPLTQLYNKEEVQRQIENCIRHNPQQSAALFILDIDNFKGVNDNLGHQFGDTVLREVAQKTKSIFREVDILGRLGGDELVVFMQDVPNSDIIAAKAARLTTMLNITYFGETSKYTISASTGIAYYPQHGQSFHDLYRMADIALYESKRCGKNRHTIYCDRMSAQKMETRTPLDSAELFLNTYYAEDFSFSIFEMLYETKDIKTTINMILEQLGRKFDVDRVYIFENSIDGLYVNNTYEWCAPGIAAELVNLQNLNVDFLDKFFANYNENGILCCNDITTLDQFAFNILKPQEIKSLLHCALRKGGEVVGFIGFDDCTQQRNWRREETAMLAYVSRILSVFMIQNRTMRELVQTHENYMGMLDNLVGYVYVVDVENYELLYVNAAVRKLGGQVGQKCHQMAFEQDRPCANCPIKNLNANTPFATEKIRSLLVDNWVYVAASRMKWGGWRNAALICCTDISKYEKECNRPQH